MASEEHIVLSDYIKSVHEQLRHDSKSLGADLAWRKHCENEDNLRKYAEAMQELATKHWEDNYQEHSKAVSRIEWVYLFAVEYFMKGGLSTQRRKELEIAGKIGLHIDELVDEPKAILRLLDVGSCYNPFKNFQCFEVLPIDIAPANSEVYKCDFLNINLVPNVCTLNSSQIISELQVNTFEVVAFSLLLEYLPSPDQRLLACQKAYDLLKPEGILIIITPDSKHVGANAQVMKSWRFILADLGFSRIKYEKLPYLHCMVFRKSLCKDLTKRWASLQHSKPPFSEIVIPQDFKKTVREPESKNNTHCEWDVNLFEELPEF